MREAGLTGSFWPDETQRGLLQVALGPREQAAARWQALQPLEVSHLPIGSFSVLPLLHERLAEVAPDDPQLRRLGGTSRNIWLRNQLLFEKAGLLLQRLREHGVDALLVGGAAAVRRWYSAVGVRPALPLELMVRPADVPEAADVCVSLGWSPRNTRDPLLRFESIERFPLLVHSGAPAAVAGLKGAESGYDTLRSRAQELTLDDETALVLDPADALLLACATGARTVLPPSFQWLIDAHHIISSSSSPPPDEVAARARELRLVEPLRATLLYLERLIETPDADRYLATLGGSRGSLREQLEFALMGAPVGRAAGPAQLVAGHLRESGDESLPKLVGSFPRYLERTWRTESLGATLETAVRKAVRQQRQARKRSASSRAS
ncbi:MAG: hypothetical protein QOG85_2221 [Gaiellaceae bacterium]|nr:hypothetical protein [Gaiellaceae bacterium]